MTDSLRHLNALRAFDVAAKHASFAKAGKELNVSHSVISQHIKNLENWLGVKLFVRLGNRVELSDDGRELRPQIANGFRILGDACDGLLRMSEKSALTISAEPALASLWLRKRVTEFCETFSGFEVELRPAWHPPQLGENHADIVIHFETRLPTKGTKKTRLFPIDGFPACSPQLKASLDKLSAGIDWHTAPLVHDNGREVWHQWFSKHEPQCRTWEDGRVYSDLSLAIDAAVDGEGVILADSILCQRELDIGSLVKLDPRQTRCTWYSLAYSMDATERSAPTVFANWLTSQPKF